MRFALVVLLVTLLFVPGVARGQAVHRGFFDASLKPLLTIDSGDVVRLETATGNPRYFEKLRVPKDKNPAELDWLVQTKDLSCDARTCWRAWQWT